MTRPALVELVAAPAGARFNYESAAGPIDYVLGQMLGAGGAIPEKVGRLEALSVPAVLRGRNMIVGTLASLELEEIARADRRRVASPLLEQIDPDVADVVTMASTIEDLFFEGISWWYCLDFEPIAAGGYPLQAQHIDHSRITLQPRTSRQPDPLPAGLDPRPATVDIYLDGHKAQGDTLARLIRFDSPQPGLLKVAGHPIRRAMALDRAARMYAENPQLQDFLSPADGQTDPADDSEVEEILESWLLARRRRVTGYVPAALKHNTVQNSTPRDLQLAELQRQVSLELANAMGLDPEDLGVSTTSRTYQNATDRRQDRINDVLMPYMRAITDRLSMPDITRPGRRIEFNLSGYLRADPRTQAEVDQVYSTIGATDAAEIRERRDWPRRAISPPPATTGPAAAAVAGGADFTAAIDAAVAAAGTPATFAADESLAFASEPTATVDAPRRRITGLALPYNVVALKNGRRFMFRQGSLEWGALDRVKFLRDHDYAQAIGVPDQLDDQADGLHAVFKVGRGKAGDDALALAEDKVLDGLSPGVDILDTIPHPTMRGVEIVTRARLREISLLAMPAYDDARVTSVAASADNPERNTMDCSHCGTQHAAGVACPTGAGTVATTTAQAAAGTAAAVAGAPALFTLDQTREIAAAALAEFAETQAQRQLVDPRRGTAVTSVAEPLPYRFELDARGEQQIVRGTHDFSSDLVAGWSHGDLAARQRADDFVRVQFDVITSDVNEINPTRNRPDMYVDQREFRYPIWEAISKGSLGDITPFTFPKFNAASGLVGNHTEGTEPSSGTMTTTSQTVTPSAVSGKMKLSREVWDQGGNPQVSQLVWRQMVRAHFEALEAAAVALLDAATPTAITLTTGATDTALTSELESKLTLLQFIRGGYAFTDAFGQVDLYMALAGAETSSGEKVYPIINPSNRNGTMGQRGSYIEAAGTRFLPAWALAASGTAVASSYLFDRETVHGWASAPQRLDITMTEVANVYIGLWAYKATAISDITGVREITYDPAV